jgi:hypothetical protein
MGGGDGDAHTGEVVLDVNLDGFLVGLLTRWLKDDVELAKLREVAEEPAHLIRTQPPVVVGGVVEYIGVKATEIAGVRRALGVPGSVLQCDFVDALELLSKVVATESCRVQHF